MKAPLIGFDRFVDIEWCELAFEAAAANAPIDSLRELVSKKLPGVESQRKTIDILKRLSTNPFPQLKDFVERGVQIFRSERASSTLLVAWGASIASYPFFGRTAETTGRLLSLQNDCTVREVQRRMSESYGDRSGIERATNRVLQTQANWMTLARDDSAKRVTKRELHRPATAEASAWLIEAAIRFSGRPLPAEGSGMAHALFPFEIHQSLGFLINANTNLVIHSQGPSAHFIALRKE